METARNLGITSFSDEQGRPRQTFGLALTLGGGQVPLLELTSVLNLIPYDQILDWAKSLRAPVLPPEANPCAGSVGEHGNGNNNGHGRGRKH